MVFPKGQRLIHYNDEITDVVLVTDGVAIKQNQEFIETIQGCPQKWTSLKIERSRRSVCQISRTIHFEAFELSNSDPTVGHQLNEV